PSHRTPKEVLDGVPYIGIGDLKSDGTIDFGNSRKVSEEVLDEHKKRYKIQEGDFIFGKIGTLGKPTLLPTDLDYTLSANVILIQPNRDIVKADYLRLTLTAPQIIKEITDKSTATSQLAFGIKKMRNFEIQLPPIQEQREIIERVKQLFAFADNIETLINNALQRVNHLTQSILHQAFTGQLTADWRAKHPELITGDNSAEILLAKIQTAKEANQKPKSTKNQAKKEKTKMVSKLKKKSNFIYANTPLEEIPLYFRGYVKAHRHFESVVAKYEPKIAEFEDVKLFQEWIGWIRSDIKEVEKMIAQVEAEEMDFGTFKDYRYDLANGQFQGSLDGFYNSDESEIAEQAFDEIRKAGYIVYDYWIDSRQATDKLD
ncbi:hypothetical protein ZQ79_23390, partial [Salmonella enterica subsp. enterica serovar Enteritidis]|nr:hypothetical protein [Salmonella enterica subsp. enterica serovar Enteritidis]